MSKAKEYINLFRKFLKLRHEQIYTIYSGDGSEKHRMSCNYQSWALDKLWPEVREIALNFNSSFEVVSEHMGIFEIHHNSKFYTVYLKNSTKL